MSDNGSSRTAGAQRGPCRTLELMYDAHPGASNVVIPEDRVANMPSVCFFRWLRSSLSVVFTSLASCERVAK